MSIPDRLHIHETRIPTLVDSIMCKIIIPTILLSGLFGLLRYVVGGS